MGAKYKHDFVNDAENHCLATIQRMDRSSVSEIRLNISDLIIIN